MAATLAEKTKEVAFVVQPEDRFDVRKAERDMAAVAEKNANESIELLIARVMDGQILEESEAYMGAGEALALLKTIQEDQRIPGVSAELYLIRVSRPELAPKLDRF